MMAMLKQYCYRLNKNYKNSFVNCNKAEIKYQFQMKNNNKKLNIDMLPWKLNTSTLNY